MISGNLNSACLPIRTYGDRVWQVQGRRQQSYTDGDGIFHQILTLPPGRLVPFHTTAAYRYAQLIASNPNNLEFVRSGFTYTIKNLGNGNAELGVIVRTSMNTPIFLPRLRVTVQRLT